MDKLFLSIKAISIHQMEKTRTGYTVYTKTKCKYCTTVKQLIPHAYFVNCDQYLANDRDAFLAHIDTLTDKKPRTFPMVFLNHVYLGGCTEFETYMKELEGFSLDDAF